MCGRFALGGDRDDIFNDVVRNGMLPDDADDEDWVDREDFYPRYNIAPRSRAPVIRRRRGGNDDEDVNMANADEQVANEGADDAQLDETEETSQTDEIDGDNVASSSSRGPMVQTAHNKPTHLDVPRVKSREDASKRVKYTPVPQNKLNMMQTMRWGLLHHQYTTDSPAHTTNTINARSETLLESERGIWGSIKATNRCIVVCDGYYEWLTKGKTKLPHFIRHPNASRKMYMAGLWDQTIIEGETTPLYTFSIVTTAARSDMEWLHDRAPLIFSSDTNAGRRAISLWLDDSIGWSTEVQKLLQPFQGALTIYPVPPEVGKVGKESPSFIQPVADRKDGIKAAFSKRQTVKEPKFLDDCSVEQDSSLPTTDHSQTQTQSQDQSQGTSQGRSQSQSQGQYTHASSLKRLRSESSDIVELEVKPTIKKPKLDTLLSPQSKSNPFLSASASGSGSGSGSGSATPSKSNPVGSSSISTPKKKGTTNPESPTKKPAPKSPTKGKNKAPPLGTQSITNFFAVSPRKAPK